MYQLYCAFACKTVLVECQLNCSTWQSEEPSNFETSPECFASDDASLQSLAWCVNSRCHNEAAWDIEKFWFIEAVGDGAHQHKPKYSYEEALRTNITTPSRTIGRNGTLQVTSIVIDEE
jgi:hypothetical protein